jgi:hypothetical protein
MEETGERHNELKIPVQQTFDTDMEPSFRENKLISLTVNDSQTAPYNMMIRGS